MPELDYQHQNIWPNGFGQQQSPIALTDAIPADAIELAITQPWRINQEIDDATCIRLNGIGQTIIDAQPFQFQQAHFHAPAEHFVNSDAVAELHLVHQSAVGGLAVIGLPIYLGKANATFQSVLNHFERQHTTTIELELTTLLPSHGYLYHYIGSLTTPPLTEGVQWYLIDDKKITVSPQQLAAYQASFVPNNREIQVRNHRRLLYQAFQIKERR